MHDIDLTDKDFQLYKKTAYYLAQQELKDPDSITPAYFQTLMSEKGIPEKCFSCIVYLTTLYFLFAENKISKEEGKRKEEVIYAMYYEKVKLAA